MWKQDKDFAKLQARAKSYTIIPPANLFVIYRLALRTNMIFPGSNIAEIGVFKGGSGMVLAEAAPSCHIHLFDTFEGMPETNEKDNYCWKGMLKTPNAENTIAMLDEYKNTTIYKGRFPETADSIRDLTFSFVHIDVDIYQSTKDCLEFFYPRLFSNGIVVCDDYFFPKTEGARIAVDEYFKGSNVPVAFNHQGVIIK